MIGAGNLREKITIQQPVQVQRPDGGFDTEWQTVKETFAQVTEKQPSVDAIAQQQNITGILEVRIRYNPEVAILNGYKIVWRGFEFVGMKPKVDPLRRHITLLVFSEIETTER